MTDAPYILYGMPLSLYTGKVRAYLIRRRIVFEERIAAHPSFAAEIIPKIGRFIIPVLVTPDGEIWQDGSEIIDRLEERHPNDHPVVPSSKAHAVLAHLFALFGSEGLLRAAMHYRWDFDDENLAFIREGFMEAIPIARDDDAWETFFLNSSGRMRRAKTGFGVNDQTAPTVEESYKEFLSLFNTHLTEHLFLLGDHPTIGDEGLYGPLLPHLGRDPVPALMMKTTAHAVYRWTERLAHPGQPLGQSLIDLEDPPATLLALMRFIKDEYLTEIMAHIDVAEAWLAERPDLPIGESGVDKRSRRVIGLADYTWRGHAVSTIIMPYRLWLLERLQTAYLQITDQESALVDQLFRDTGLSPMIERRTSRPVERVDNMEVWGANRSRSVRG
ncbi:MAG: glutathione S-transferase N-terminal domain-containing protein [Pseudomonadota bacterium]